MREADIINYLRDNLRLEVASISADTPLVTSGIVDSFSLISLITFIEQKSGIMAAPEDMVIENFDSIKAILGFVESKTVNQ
jgi:acyl carrier protein/D-alanine--poly(phosphoribitol) ligase subunit 2